MGATFKRGKKFLDGQEIEARHRLVFYASDGCTINTATLWVDGTTSCNCPGWSFRKKCKHADRALHLTASIDETGELSSRPTSNAAESPKATNPFRRRSRNVDT